MANIPSIVSQLRAAIGNRNKLRTFAGLGELIQRSINGQNLAAYQAGAAPVIVSALEAWPTDANVQGIGLTALFHCWGGGVPPFHDTTLTPRAIGVVLDAMKLKVLRVNQAALRLLRCHSVASAKLHALPLVAERVAEAILAHLDDETVQVWGAQTMLNLLGIDRKDVIQTHGHFGLAVLHEMVIKAAAATRQSNEVTIDGVPWSQVVLHSVFPKLRPR
jgi:hypothetical protein